MTPPLRVSSQQQVITSLPYTAFSRLETSEVPNSTMESKSNRQLLKKKKKKKPISQPSSPSVLIAQVLGRALGGQKF